ncbi:MAG TPA: phosphonate ABC transporter, permease protein PhnE [Burkholderiaceae bacterium]
MRACFVLAAVYVLYALTQLGFSWPRFVAGLDHGAAFFARMFPPDWTRMDVLWEGLAESLQIAVLASLLGIALSLPAGLLAARNLMPAWISWPARLFISACRALHPVIVAILFVKAVGFGALAGVLALAVASLGFVAKMYAEAIEEISLRPVEAVRAAGAALPHVVAYAVLPQVLPRFVGVCAYQVDSNLRNSTMVGIVGAGGVGGVLFAAFQRFDYDFVFVILLTIVAIIVFGEVLADQARKVFRV